MKRKDDIYNEWVMEFLEDRKDYLLGIAVLERDEPHTKLADLGKNLTWSVKFAQ